MPVRRAPPRHASHLRHNCQMTANLFRERSGQPRTPVSVQSTSYQVIGIEEVSREIRAADLANEAADPFTLQMQEFGAARVALRDAVAGFSGGDSSQQQG